MLSFQEWISLIVVCGGIIGVWLRLNVKIADIISKVAANKSDIDLKIENLCKETDTKMTGIKAEIDLEIKGIEEANKVRVAAIEAEIELRVQAIRSGTKGLEQFLGQRITEFVEDNKGDHKSIMDSIKQLFETTNSVGKSIARLEALREEEMKSKK